MNNMTDTKIIVYIDANIFINNVLYDLEENIEARSSNNFLQKLVNNEILGIIRKICRIGKN